MLALTDQDLEAVDFGPLLEAFTTESVTVTDADLSAAGGPRILKVNPAFEREAGYRAEEIVGQRLSILYSGDHLDQAIAQMRTAAETRQEAEITLRPRKRDGKFAWISGRAIPIFSPAGNLMCFVRVTRDVTERKRAEHEMAAAQHLLGSIFKVVEQGLAVLDENDRVVMANPALARLLDQHLGDMLGKPVKSWLTPSDRHLPEQCRLDAQQTKQSRPARVRLLRKGGTIEATLVPTAIDPRAERFYTVLSIATESEAAAPPASTQVSAPAAHAPMAHAPVQAAAPALAAAGQIDSDLAARAAVINSDKSPPTVVAGKLQLIGLEDVRRALGDRWPEFAERTFTAAETILKRFLAPRDVFDRTRDDGFLVCFADLNEQEATFKAQVLRKEIRDRLIGSSPELAETKVASFVAEIPLTPAEAGAGSGFADTIELRLKRDRERREAMLRESLWSEITPGRIRFSRVRTHSGQAAPLMIAHPPTDIEASIESLYPNGDSELNHEAGMLLLSAVAERLMSEQSAAAQELIIVPVHVVTLMERRGREAWFKIARETDPVGKNRLVCEIFGLPKDIGQARLTDIITRCAPLFRAVAIELPDCDTKLLNDLPTPARILTLPARRAFTGSSLSPAFARLSKMAGLRMRQLLVKDANRPGQAKMLGSAGVGLIEGQEAA